MECVSNSPSNPVSGRGKACPRIHTIVILSAVAFLFHALTTSSGLFWLDAGDFVTAGYDLGVPHPTGFPLYILLGKAFSCLPVGPVSFRFSLMSAVLAGVGTGLLVALVYELYVAAREGSCMAAVAVCCIALWTTDVAGLLGRTPDVYGLHMVLVSAAGLLCIRLLRRFSLGDLLLMGLVTGLGISNHAEFRLFFPAFAAVALATVLRRGAGSATAGKCAYRRSPRSAGTTDGEGGVTSSVTEPIGVDRPRETRTSGALALLAWLALVLVGILPYVYISLAASRESYHVWGHPDTFARFWNHVWGLTIQLAYPEAFLSTSWLRLTHAVEQFAGQIWEDWGAFLALSAWGAFVSARRSPSRVAVLLVLAVMDLVYAVLANPMGLRDDQNGAVVYLVLAVLGGIGTAQVLGWLEERLAPRSRWLAGGVLMLLAGLLVAHLMDRSDPQRLFLQGGWGAEDLTFQGIQQAPTAGLVLSDSEGFAAARLYLVGVGALRPDLQVLNRTEISDSLLLVQRSRQGPFPLAPDAVVEQWAGWGVGTTEETYQSRLSLLLDQAFDEDRTVLWGPGAARDSQGRWDQIDLGFPLHRLYPTPVPELFRPATPEALVPDWFLDGIDYWGRRWLADYFNWLGTYYYHVDRFDLATWAWLAAVEQAPEWSPPVVNLGLLADRRGSYTEAAALVTMATNLDPLDTTAWLNLARYRCLLGETEGAWAAYRRAEALQASPDRLAAVQAFLQRCPEP